MTSDYEALQKENEKLKEENKKLQKRHQESWKAFSNYIEGKKDRCLDGIRSVKIKELKEENATLRQRLDRAIQTLKHIADSRDNTGQWLCDSACETLEQIMAGEK